MLSTLEMSQEEIEQRNALIVKLKIWLSQSFPGCHFLPFGSSEIGLATCHSDFDLCFLFCSSTGNNRLACLLNFYITITVFKINRREKGLGCLERDVRYSFRTFESGHSF